MFESLVHQQIYSYFSTNNLLSPAQSGFRPGHRTQDLLIKVSKDWKITLDCDKIIGITFIDLHKAFDSIIDRSLLMAKLCAYGFDDVSIRWFHSYRQQRVILDNVYSDWATVATSCVPHGSILRPLLFIIYMNDLPNVICQSHLHLFADDITMYTSDADPVIVQDDLNSDLASLFE